MSLRSLYVLLGEMSVQVFCPFFNCFFCLPGVELCEFFINFVDQTLFEVSLANMFSHIVGFLFILILLSLAMQKLLCMISHLFILSFITLALGDISVKILLHGISEIFVPMFSSRTFMVSRLIFKSFINLEFIGVWCKLVVEFHFFCM